MIKEHYIYCALYFYYYYISSASDHQALDPRGWWPLLEPWFPELWLCRQIIWQNTCNTANNIGGIISKYFSHEPSTPSQVLKRLLRLENGSLKAEIWFFIWFIKCVTLKDSSCVKTQRSAWIVAQVPPWGAERMSRAMQFRSTAFLIMETSEFNRLIAWLPSFKACWMKVVKARLDMANYILLSHWRHIHTLKKKKRLLNGHISRIQIFWSIRLIRMVDWLGLPPIC